VVRRWENEEGRIMGVFFQKNLEEQVTGTSWSEMDEDIGFTFYVQFANIGQGKNISVREKLGKEPYHFPCNKPHS